MEKAQSEFEEYYSNSPTPRPHRDIPEPDTKKYNDDGILAKKMQMFNEIQSRFSKHNVNPDKE
jgi:hypothetical protein